MLGYWNDRWYLAMHSSISLRIEFKNRFVIPYIKDYDKKNTLISYSLRISIISKSIKFYGLLQLVSKLLVLVLEKLKWILISIVCFSMVCTRQRTHNEPPSMQMRSKGKDVDNWQEKGLLDDTALYVPVISS